MSTEGTQPIRTWTLRASSDVYPRCAAHLELPGPSMAAGEVTEVFDAEPVLDLVERLVAPVRPARSGQFTATPGFERRDADEAAARALLREHGRLP
jgi:hypothetical protein